MAAGCPLRDGPAGVAATGSAAGPALTARRIYPLTCLIVIAVCAFTTAGERPVYCGGQWIRRAGQAALARLRAPWGPDRRAVPGAG
jgi:hypothetical protein